MMAADTVNREPLPEAQAYALGLLNEECGEIAQLVGKCLRFGIDTPNGTGPDAETAREMLEKEAGDALAAIDFATRSGLIGHAAVHTRADAKFAKLINPDSTDNLGRRLAPGLPEALSTPLQAGGGRLRLPENIRESVLRIGRAEWGHSGAKPDADHASDFVDTLRLTREHFNTEGDADLHYVAIEGTDTPICLTGTSPNSAQHARTLTAAWNYLVDLAAAPALSDKPVESKPTCGTPNCDNAGTRLDEDDVLRCPDCMDGIAETATPSKGEATEDEPKSYSEMKVLLNERDRFIVDHGLWDEFVGSLSSKGEEAEPVAWRCFHCDEVFTDEARARTHFGREECSAPACQIKAGAEGSLLKALRRAEEDAAEAWGLLHSENDDFSKAYHRQAARHVEQLRITEELGYERGVADARAEHVASPTSGGLEDRSFAASIEAKDLNTEALDRAQRAHELAEESEDVWAIERAVLAYLNFPGVLSALSKESSASGHQDEREKALDEVQALIQKRLCNFIVSSGRDTLESLAGAIESLKRSPKEGEPV